jgi:PKD repeat protein
MLRMLTSCSPILTTLVVVTALLGAMAPQASAAIDAVSPTSFVVARAPEVVASQTRSMLPNRDGATARVWVFFTDKKVLDERSFQTAAASVQLSPKVLARRAKVGTNKVLFLDLPVAREYVQQIQALGATLRRESGWLNAASFDMTMEQLAQIEKLPFVAEIRPVARYLMPVEPQVSEEVRPPAPPTSLVNPSSSYGNSYTQLNLMGVPSAHAQGYNGQGVTLAVFDAGFRKTHEVFASALAEGRLLAEYNFVFNVVSTAPQVGDDPNSWSHGTSTWSLAGGFKDGTLYGGAYKANFLLAKTEDTRSEHHVEEDNWVAALQWADSLGADVITSSLGYGVMDSPDISYTYADMNGLTAICSKAASKADSMGIVVCNSMGNEGPVVGTITAPADAFGILAVGAVTSGSAIASFSSRGPTYDGRTKPEICAMGVNTWVASSGSNTSYSNGFSGTSAACPLAAGAAVLLVQARPSWPPSLIRQAIMETASRASTPDNNYGWGIIKVNSALSWGINFSASSTVGQTPLTVQFTDSSQLATSSLLWDFGDGNTSTATNPSHIYTSSGNYTVTLTGQTTYGPISRQRIGLVAALGDTLSFGTDSALAGRHFVTSVRLKNSQPLVSLMIPFRIASSPLHVSVDSITAGTRIAAYTGFGFPWYDDSHLLYEAQLTIDTAAGQLPLPAGDGEIVKIYVSTNPLDFGGLANTIDSTVISTDHLKLTSAQISYTPTILHGAVATTWVKRGDVTGNNFIDLADLSTLVSYLTGGGATVPTVQSGDWNASLLIDLADLSSMVSYLTTGAPFPVNP